MARLLSLAEVCTEINRSAPTVRGWIAEGLFPAAIVDMNGTRCWPENVVKAWETLLLAGFFTNAVKSKLAGKSREILETAGRTENGQN